MVPADADAHGDADGANDADADYAYDADDADAGADGHISKWKEETVPADADDVSADYPHMILMLTIII